MEDIHGDTLVTEKVATFDDENVSKEAENLEIFWNSKEEALDVKMFTRRVWKNIILVSLVFHLNFLSFGGLSRLQSSLHVQEGMGVICTSLLYFCLVISCFFLPKPLIYRIGHKWVITLSLIGYILWMGANGYGVWGTMIPASILVGICAAPLWITQCSYFTELAKMYAKLTHKEDSAVISMFFGVLFMFFQSSAVVGNIISSTILKQSPPENYTSPSDEEIAEYCGIEQCPWSNSTSTSEEGTPANIVWILCGVYIAIGILGFLISAVFVDNLPQALQPQRNKQDSVCKETFQFLGSTVKQMKKRQQLLLIPITVYSGIQQSFLNAEWNKSWVTCTLGIWMVGLINIPFAVSDAMFSFLGGRLNKFTGRLPLFIIGLLIDTGIQITLAVWIVNPQQTGMFYGIPTVWGISDALWQTQINAMYGSIFGDDSEAAFSNYRLWESLGLMLAFGYSYFLCTSVKLYIMFGLLWLGLIGYFLVEMDHHRSTKTNVLNKDGEENLNDMEIPINQYMSPEKL